MIVSRSTIWRLGAHFLQTSQQCPAGHAVDSNGGRSWARQRVPGHGRQIFALAATATTTYAVVSSCAFGTGLCHDRGPLSLWRTATLTGRTWTRVSLTLPINDYANVSAYGKTAYAVDADGVMGKVSA